MFEDIRLIQNTTSNPITVWLEPWASDFEVLPGEYLRIVGRSEQEGHLEVVDYDDRVGVYIWAGSSIQVFCGDELLEDFPTLFDDEFPGGGSLRSFTENFFGGPGGVGPPKKRFRDYFTSLMNLLRRFRA